MRAARSCACVLRLAALAPTRSLPYSAPDRAIALTQQRVARRAFLRGRTYGFGKKHVPRVGVGRVFAYCTPGLGLLLVAAVTLTAGLLALFTIHAVTFWLSTDPERAFHTARRLVGWYATAWNTYRDLYNNAVYVGTRFIPAWNAMAKHAVEPVVFVALDVVSVVFAHKHYQGVLSEAYRF